jgi:hypothetical protein
MIASITCSGVIPDMASGLSRSLKAFTAADAKASLAIVALFLARGFLPPRFRVLIFDKFDNP